MIFTSSPYQRASRFRLFLVVPAYNPGEVVIDVIRESLPLADAIVLVDDGCDPENRRHLERCAADDKVTLLTHARNLGKGHALYSGIHWCLERMGTADFILTMDSDGQHRPRDIRRFAELAAVTSGVHLVLGERLDPMGMPWKSHAGNTLARLAFRLRCGGDVFDTQTGFRMLSKRFAGMCARRIAPGRFETEMKMLILAARELPKIHSLEIPTVYYSGNRNSKFSAVRDSLRITRLFASYSAVSVASFLLDYLVFIALTYWIGVAYLTANILARAVSALFNFLAHKRFSFKSDGVWLHEAMKYAGAVVFALVQSSALLFFCVHVLHFPGYAAKPFVDLLVFLANFLILSRVVFKD